MAASTTNMPSPCLCLPCPARRARNLCLHRPPQAASRGNLGALQAVRVLVSKTHGSCFRPNRLQTPIRPMSSASGAHTVPQNARVEALHAVGAGESGPRDLYSHATNAFALNLPQFAVL